MLRMYIEPLNFDMRDHAQGQYINLVELTFGRIYNYRYN